MSGYGCGCSEDHISPMCPILPLDVPGLDPGIAPMVRLLRQAGLHTWESCEGGAGHAFREPAVRFGGGMAEGHIALGVAMFNVLPVRQLRRFWRIEHGEVEGPFWEMTFGVVEANR